MPTQRLSMRRIKQLLAMHFGAGASTRAIGRELGIAPSTVREYLGRAAAAGISWPLAADVTDESLEARLFVNAGVRAGTRLPSLTGQRWCGNSNDLASICWYSGTNIVRSIRQATPTAVSASCSVNSSSGCHRRCASSTWRATRHSWTTPASGCRSSIQQPARCARPRYSSPCSAAPTSPMRRRPGRSRYRTGSAPMSACSASIERLHVCWCRTISRAASTRRRSTTPK